MPTELTRSRALPGHATVEVVQADAGTTLFNHAHDLPHILILLEGAFKEEGRIIRGQAVRYSPADQRHFVHFEQDSQCVLILLDRTEALLEEQLFLHAPHLSASAMDWARLSDSSTELCYLKAQGVFEDACGVLEESGGRTLPDWLLKARQMARDAVARRLSVSTLAEECYVSREHLSRMYRRYFGADFKDFLRAQKLASAYELVTQSDSPLAEVAFECGFADQSHLTRAFVEQFGTTPGALRRERAPALGN